MRGGKPKAIGDLIAGFLADEKVGRAVAREALEAAWIEAVGAEVGAETRVRGLRDGVLAVEVASSALLQELSTFYQQPLLAALRAKGPPFPEVRRLSFKLGVFDASRPAQKRDSGRQGGGATEGAT